MLELNNISVSIEKKMVVERIHLAIDAGTVHAVMGPNGSGKSSLACALMGHPQYVIQSGTILFQQKNITDFAPEQRARLGLFLSMQNPPALPGVSVFSFLQEIYRACVSPDIQLSQLQDLIMMHMEQLHINPAILYRNVHEGFSGGEKKRFEMLQVLLLRPSLVILDEIDSGLDIDAVGVVAQAITRMKQENPHISFVIITHHRRILDYVQPDRVHILCNGSLRYSGDVTVIEQLEREGYHAYEQSV